MNGTFEVLDGGPLTTVQDAGRPGLAHFGVSPSGFLDAPSARLANRLVGNPESAALLETTGRGPRLRLLAPPGDASGVIVALTGAPAPIWINGHSAEPLRAQMLWPGDVLAIGQVTAGVRSYLAIRGGLLVPEVLGSRSTDLLSQLGPSPLAVGDELQVGVSDQPVPAADAVPGLRLPPAAGGPLAAEVDVYPGPSQSWFTPAAVRAFATAAWTVSPTSSRVGLRLTGPPLARSDHELPPEGMVTGSIQVPPDGQPVVLLNDHPTTGGYPVIAVLCERDLGVAAQAAPGTTIRFRMLNYPRSA